ncbi:MAG: hypothetical protein V4484_11275 [Pseudomonadota bacterium]
MGNRCRKLRWHALDVDKAARAAYTQQAPGCIWFTGAFLGARA